MKWLCTLLVLVSGHALACRCAQSSLDDRFAKASLVFVGSTKATADVPRRHGETVSFQITRSLKGGRRDGSKVAIDPLFDTDCTAPFVADAQLLVFAFTQPGHTPIVSACSIRATEPVTFEGRLLRPEPEVLEFLRSH